MNDDKKVALPTGVRLRTLGEDSFKWGEDYKVLRNKYDRGISHGDMIDLNRENIKGFDVREFYVDLVSGLKARGL